MRVAADRLDPFRDLGETEQFEEAYGDQPHYCGVAHSFPPIVQNVKNAVDRLRLPSHLPEAPESSFQQAPQLVIRLRRDQVNHLVHQILVRNPAGGYYNGREVIGSLNWAWIRMCAMEIHYIDSGTPTINLVVSHDGYTAFSGKQGQQGATIRVTKANPSSPWALAHLSTVITHEFGHWYYNLGGVVDAGWHTNDRRDLLYRYAGVPRNVFVKHNPEVQSFFGLSLRELIYVRTRIGLPLVIT